LSYGFFVLRGTELNDGSETSLCREMRTRV